MVEFDTLNITGSEITIYEIRIYNRVLNSNEIKIDSNDRDGCKYNSCLIGDFLDLSPFLITHAIVSLWNIF